jgi:hypothetical protein
VINFLGKIAALLVAPILNWLYDKVVRSLKDYIARKKAEKAIKNKNEAIRAQTEGAQSKEDREAAAKNVIDNF